MTILAYVLMTLGLIGLLYSIIDDCWLKRLSWDSINIVIGLSIVLLLCSVIFQGLSV